MNTSLVLICLVIAFSATEALPGMRDNGASGKVNDRDPSNPAFQDIVAKALSSGKNPFSYTFTHEKKGSKAAFAQASNTGGGAVKTSARA